MDLDSYLFGFFTLPIAFLLFIQLRDIGIFLWKLGR